jgi:BNR repeat-like domain
MKLKSLRLLSFTSLTLVLCIFIIIFFLLSINLGYSQTSKILQLSNEIINSTFPQIKTIDNNTIFVFWIGNVDHGVNDEIQSDIFFAKSEDKGNSFGELVNLSNNSGSSFNPQSEISATDNIYVVWEDDTFARPYGLNTNTSILFKQSNDNGTTFSAPISLSSTDTDSSNPDITTANDNNVYVVWQDNSDIASKIVLKRSISDKNIIFADERIISDHSEGSNEILPQIIVADNNTVNIIWTDINVKKESSQLLKRTSLDGGKSFGESIQQLATNYSKFAGNDKIKTYNNNVYIGWQANIKGQFDIFLSKSSDGGITFSEPINVSIDSGDSINPDLIVLHNNIHVIWNDNSTKKYDIIIKTSSDGGITFSEPINLSNTTNSNSMNPQLAATANELFVVWQEDISGNNEIYFTTVDFS